MQRREFLKRAATLAASCWLDSRSTRAAEAQGATVMTVTGSRPAEKLGVMLPHEHMLVDFIGADQVSPDRYDPDKAFKVMLPHLKQVRELGCETIAECTPAYLGRDPLLLKRLSEASGVTLLTNTGYYGAREGKFLPKHAFEETADQLADRWVREWKEGIADTGIRPGFMKIGVDAGPLTDVNRKLIQAAARCHLETGLTIAVHTGDGRAAIEQVEILLKERVSPAAWIWVHAQNERDPEIYRRLAEKGGWVEFDGVSLATMERHVQLVSNMKRARSLEHVLVSHDAGWYSVGEPGGGKVRPFDTLYTQFVPALKQAGLSDDELRQLTAANPAKAFAIKVRRL